MGLAIVVCGTPLFYADSSADGDAARAEKPDACRCVHAPLSGTAQIYVDRNDVTCGARTVHKQTNLIRGGGEPGRRAHAEIAKNNVEWPNRISVKMKSCWP